MEASFHNSRERLRDLTLDFLWCQWTSLGVAGQARLGDPRIIDPEALLLATTTFGRYDPRLFDEVLDWLNTNGQAINLQRLQTLSQNLGQRAVLEGMSAHLAKRTANAKWKTLLGKAPISGSPELLFPEVPVFGQPDGLFAHYGWLRGPLKLRQLSQPPDPHQAANLLFKLRALFGMQARAEVMAYLLAHESGHPGEMAERLAYFPRTLQTTLNDLARSGHVMTRRESHEKRFWLRRDEWRFLITWPAHKAGGLPEFPHWVGWAPLFAALEAVWKFLNRADLASATPAIQAIELRACIETLPPAFLREHIKTPPGTSGAAFIGSVLNDLWQMLK